MTEKKHAPVYTGEIAAQIVDSSQEYTAATQEIAFTREQHAIWTDLFAGIYQPHFMEHVCQEYLDGFNLLQMDPAPIP
ncbi:MAG: hypothetical protein P8046_06235, partial [Anaerolineales bacterium]